MPLPTASFGIMSLALLVLPPVLGYFFIAWLAVTPQTHSLRLASWPVVVLFAIRAAVFVDISPGESNSKFGNMLFVFSMLFIVTRTFDWIKSKEPLTRYLRPAKGSPSAILDGLDLAMTLRGYGWDWARGVSFPHETRPTSRGGFTLYVILSAAFHSLISGVLHVAIRSFSPTGLGAFCGGSIFDETLPFYLQYFRGSVITIFAWFAIYSILQTYYDICTVVAILFLGQDPSQWPPAFDSPWRATSMCDFWGRRWHQFFRRTFIVQCGYPLSFLLGPAGFIIGTFLSSGILHHIAMLSLNDKAEPLEMLLGFGMMAPVILVERAFKQFTGKRVSGLMGWVWTTTWLFLWGNMIIDAFAKGGIFGHFSFIESMVPGQELVRRWVTNFDAWLHAM